MDFVLVYFLSDGIGGGIGSGIGAGICSGVFSEVLWFGSGGTYDWDVLRSSVGFVIGSDVTKGEFAVVVSCIVEVKVMWM